MSEIKVNKITPRAACGTTTLGDSGDTITIPSGATIQNLGTATGFGGTGVVSWDTASIKTAGFTAVTGTGYFCDTTGGAFTVTLPLSPAAGAVVGVADYAQTFDTDNLTLGRNGSNIGGLAEDGIVATEGIAVTLVYVDATKGWIVTDSGTASDASTEKFVTATGGCITTCGNYKMHTFLSPNTFVVTCEGNPLGSNTVDYLIVGAGGGGAGGHGGAGGSGGYRFSTGAASGCYTAGPAPLGNVALSVPATPYAIAVGGGGTAGSGYAHSTPSRGGNGNLSSFSTIISSGGGGGGGYDVCGASGAGLPGGSGGGGVGQLTVAGGTGNIPVQSPPQGNDGGASSGPGAAGGGGAGAQGSATSPSPPATGGPGGVGLTSSINSVATFRGGGGGAGAGGGNTAGTGGNGGGGAGSGNPCASVAGTAGTVNTGGGGGGGPGGGVPAGPPTGGGGGSGIVIIRYKYQ